jgi:branched-chain amino acid transport system substrate-binding protein
MSISGLLAAVLVCLQVACSPSEGPETGEAIKIGVIVPVTGSVSVWGENTLHGIQLAAEQVNEAGGIAGERVELVVEDSKCEPEEAVRILRNFIDRRAIQVVLGNVCSSNVLAMAPIAQRNQVVLFSTGASNPKISEAGDFIFRNWPSDAVQGRLTAHYAREGGDFERAAILYVNNAYGQGLEQVFREEFEQMGGEVLLSETYSEGATDFRGPLSRIKERNPELLYLPAYTQEYPLILRQAEEIGLEAPILGSETFDDPQTIQAAGDAAEGVVFPSPAAFDTERPKGAAFQEAFVEKFGKSPGITADTAYDALMIVAEAMESGARTGPELRDYIMNLKDFEGVAGLTTFDAQGDAPKAITFYEVREGQAVPLDYPTTPR